MEKFRFEKGKIMCTSILIKPDDLFGRSCLETKFIRLIQGIIILILICSREEIHCLRNLQLCLARGLVIEPSNHSTIVYFATTPATANRVLPAMHKDTSRSLR